MILSSYPTENWPGKAKPKSFISNPEGPCMVTGGSWKDYDEDTVKRMSIQ